MMRCPNCHQPLPDSERDVRVCRNCEEPIRRHDKWRFVTTPDGTFIEHRHCDNPTSYLAKERAA